jgi:hypothetical protein
MLQKNKMLLLFTFNMCCIKTRIKKKYILSNYPTSSASSASSLGYQLKIEVDSEFGV